ncbi:MAG: ubiquinol-cytochrome c reductase iron-sulfur subunit [Candidatus Kapaibacterium sp.]|nr:MAG: ubiquinol-cytochrome c reductase iron-sulfur subunit [Candidatus Kapabacteria bacterium]
MTTQSNEIPQSLEHEERRGFLKNTLRVALGVYAASGAFAVWRFLRSPSERRVIPQPLALNVVEFEREKQRIVKFGDKTVLLRYDKTASQPDKTHRAFNLRCTHAGCTVRWLESERKFLCPCHGAEFAANGTVTRLPATEPLEELSLKLDSAQGNLILRDAPVQR